MSRNWLLWGLVLLPLVWWPWSDIPYEVPKVTIFLLWSAGLFVLTALDTHRQLFNVRYLCLVGIYLAILLSASFWGVDWDKSLVGNYYRRDGLFTIATLFLVSVVVGWIKVEKQKIFQALAGSGVILSILAITKGVGGWSVFGNPNFLAGYLVTIFPAFFAVFKSKKWLVLAVLLHHTALLFTQSWVGVILVVGYWIGRMRQSKLVYPLIAILVTCLVITISIFGKQAADSLVKSNHFRADSRARVYLKLILGGLKRPWLGYGVANVDYAFEVVDWPMKFGSDIYVDKAHGSLLEVLMTSGFVGLAGYLALISYIVYRVRQIGDSEVGVMLLLSFLFAQTNVISISQEVVFWVLTGAAMGRYNHLA